MVQRTIAAKMGTSLANEKSQTVLAYASDCVEFHLNSMRDTLWIEAVKTLCPRRVVLHTPMACADVMILFNSNGAMSDLKKLIKNVKEVKEVLNVDIRILMHVGTTGIALNRTGVDKRMETYLQYDVPFLLENCIQNVNDDQDGLLYLLKHFRKTGMVHMCFDVCHYRASENMLGYCYVNRNFGKYIQWIHFAHAANGDGFRRGSGTHAAVHDSVESVRRDLFLLDELGVDSNVPICIEVNEDDYTNRLNEEREIELVLETYKKLNSEEVSGFWQSLEDSFMLGMFASKKKKEATK